MDEIRWGMVGCGAVTVKKSAPAFQTVAGSRLAAVSSRRPEAARDYAHKNDIDLCFAEPEDMIRSPHVDAIYVATPPSSHLHYALLAAAAGKPCCVEKPMAMSEAQAAEMVAAFEAATLPLFASYYRRSLPRFRQIRDWLAQDRIGTVRHVHWTLVRPPSQSDLEGENGWRTSSTEAPGGYFDDLGCHGLDLLDFLIGPIETCSGIKANQQSYYEVPDTVAACWHHANGATGTGHWNFAGFGKTDIVTIHGSAGEIGFSVFEDAPLLLETNAEKISLSIDNPDPIQLYHVEAMVRHIHGESEHPSTGETALRTARIMEQILRPL